LPCLPEPVTNTVYCTDINSESKRVGETIKFTGYVHESIFDVGSGQNLANFTIAMLEYNSTILISIKVTTSTIWSELYTNDYIKIFHD